MSRNTAVWGITLLLEAAPGSTIDRAAAEAVEFASTLCYYGTSQVALAFNEFILRIHKDSSAESVCAEYYRKLERKA